MSQEKMSEKNLIRLIIFMIAMIICFLIKSKVG